MEALSPVHQVETKHGAISFRCPNKLTEFRARSFHEKEPETLEWIDSLSPGEVLWDIGANVGLYSLYAAKRGLRVLASEPAPANYYLLNANVEDNGLFESLTAYCLAFSRKSELGYGSPEHAEPVIEHMTKAGFQLASKRRSPIFDDTEFANLYNVFFRRKGIP